MQLVHGFGFWTIRFLLIALAITPMRRLADWPDIVLVRRMVGVTAMAYGLAHLTLYAIDENGRLVFVASEIVHRVYLTIGFVTLSFLVLLGIDLDRWLGAPDGPELEAAPPRRLSAGGARHAAFLHAGEGERLRSGDDVGLPALAVALAAVAGALPGATCRRCC